jgi:hypothetical protein
MFENLQHKVSPLSSTAIPYRYIRFALTKEELDNQAADATSWSGFSFVREYSESIDCF